MSGTALVTGAGSGIGRAFAVELARRGETVVLVGRREALLREVAATLPGGPHEVLPGDLASEAGCEAVAARLRAERERVATLVNAAGVGTARPFPDADLAAEEAQLAVNVTAVMRLSWAAARAMRERGGGRIVNVASTAAFWSTGTYAASKVWVVKASEGLAASLGDDRVTVLCVVPGFTRTEFHASSGVDNSAVARRLWLDAGQVARESLAAVDRGSGRFVPSRRYRVLLAVTAVLPGSLRGRMVRRLAPLRPAD
ncbi:MAG TPA: SDR family NAD(P)-dependent oxidoreductase [Solirubrobacterales bacterium]